MTADTNAQGPSSADIPIDEPLAVRMALAIARYGEERVVQMAVGLLRGENEGEDILLYLGARHAQGVLGGAPALYWPEVWGARALNSVWDDSAAPVVLAGLGNQAWRVREMCAKVCVTRRIGDTAAFTPLLVDEVPRVRSAAALAIAERGTEADAEAIRPLLRDPDKEVRRSARDAVARLEPRAR
jgi:HEAT repeat protein